MMKNLWQLKREFLEHCEIEKGHSILTINNYSRYLDRFLEWLKKNKPSVIPSEVHEAEGSLRSAVAPVEMTKDIFPNDIDRETVRKYRLFINRLRDKRGRELKSSTQNHHILALRAFLRYLSRVGVKTISPDEIILAKTTERSINFLNAEEFIRLLEAPTNKRDKAILDILFSTGMRVSELTSLNIGDINFDQGEISVMGKGKKVRVVFLSESAIRSLVEHLLSRKAISIKSEYRISNIETNSKSEIQNPKHEIPDTKYPIPDTQYEILDTKYKIPDTNKKLPLFLSVRNERINVRAIERMVQKYGKIAGIGKTVSPHTLRHTFATDLLVAGADIRSVQSLLGHRNISTTQVYTHITDQHLRKIHQKYHHRSDGNNQ